MEIRPLEITVISANDLRNAGLFSKMRAYVVVYISDDPNSKCRTPIDKNGGKSPKWNHKVNLFVDENYLSRNPRLIFNIRADRTFSVKDVGEVSIPVKELLDSFSAVSAERIVEHKVRTPKGKSKGTLKFSYKFGEKSNQPTIINPTKNTEPVTAYPVFMGEPSRVQPPPANAYQAPPGYPYPKPETVTGGGYGYGSYPPPPPPPHGYGGYPPAGYGGYGSYPPQQPPMMMQAPQKKKRSNFGLGLLGGLLVGDMISGAGDMAAYDAGYDDGFDDSAFGF